MSYNDFEFNCNLKLMISDFNYVYVRVSLTRRLFEIY